MKLTESELTTLEERLRTHICGFCIERKTDGTCGLSAVETCPMIDHIHQLVEVTSSVDSRYLGDYYQPVRTVVCSQCSHSDEFGDCGLRREGHCALESYLSPIVEIVEDFLQETGRLRT